MGKQRRSNCRVCGASGNDGPISLTGRCERCSEAALLDHNRSQRTHIGPGYDRWARAYMAAIERDRALLNDADASSN